MAESRGLSRALVKICGLTRAQDVDDVVELGADLIGLNFWTGSPRCVSVELGRSLAQQARGRTQLVGVFVNASAAEVVETAAAVGLDLVQPHGNESPDFADELAALGGPAVLRAIRVAHAPTAAELEAWPNAWGFLFDRFDAVRFGGTGEGWEWEAMRNLPRTRPLLVAGGVRPGRARIALEASQADGVDVCSGVESGPGIKDRAALERLFAEVRDVSIATTA